jgi:hypothetical protein
VEVSGKASWTPSKGVGRGIQILLPDRDQAQRMGEAAHRRVREEYLAPRRLTQELDLIERVADGTLRGSGGTGGTGLQL